MSNTIRGPTNLIFEELSNKNESFIQLNSINATGLSELDNPIIGVLSGEYARLNSVSTNKRLYTEEFWKKVIYSEMVRKRLRDGLMVSTFEHTNARSFFTGEGELSSKHHFYGSHVVKELEVKGNIVWGRSYILNTPMGRLLAMYLRAKDSEGKPLFNVGISVRGFTRKDYINPITGNDELRDDDYYLEAFDATLTPGILTARPKLESMSNDDLILKEIGDYESKVKSYYCDVDCELQQLKRELKINI
jgi:hypothetical protein